MSTFALIVTLALGQNVVLVHYLGVYPLPALLYNSRRAAIMSAAVTAAILWVSLVYWIVFRYVLVPLELTVLNTLVAALIVGLSTVAGLQLGTRIAPFHRRALRQGVPAAVVNVSVFVVATALVEHVPTLWQVLAGALAGGFGIFLATVPMAAIRRHLRDRRIPTALRGDVTVYLAAGMMALAIQQLDGLLQRFLVPIY